MFGLYLNFNEDSNSYLIFDEINDEILDESTWIPTVSNSRWVNLTIMSGT